MIRGVVIHVAGEQPLLADLYDMPKASDVGLVCTNIRTMDGRKPIFIDHSDSVFFFPYLHIRFLEIMAGATAERPELPATTATAPATEPEPAPEPDLEIDEDFLRRIREA